MGETCSQEYLVKILNDIHHDWARKQTPIPLKKMATQLFFNMKKALQYPSHRNYAQSKKGLAMTKIHGKHQMGF